jgi:dimethylhistidine N-methyltransferase
MTPNTEETIDLHDFEPPVETFRREALDGLTHHPKLLPCKYLYDERGSRLFDRICELDEYYPTRTELAIMRDFGTEIADALGEGCLIIEYGSGSSLKTRTLLSHLKNPAGYVPLDISREHLEAAAAGLAAEFPDLEILPVCADYTANFDLPAPSRPVRHRAVYFPGSTIGNFHLDDALDFLRHIAEVVEPGGGLLIGVDLRKDRQTLERAYNDAQGVTAEFNLNLLDRMNRELGADFDRRHFEFRAEWNDDIGHIESFLISQTAQTVTLGDTAITFEQDERTRTECSYKFTLDQFAALAAKAGFSVRRVWCDRNKLFSVQYLVAD